MKKRTLFNSSLSLLCAMVSNTGYAEPTQTPNGRVNVPWSLVPEGDLVLNRTTVKLRMSNQRFGLIKVLSADGKKGREIAVNERGEPVDLKAILREDKQAYLAKYGKISPPLYNKIEKSRGDELFLVAVWVAVEDDPVNKSKTKQFDMLSFNHLLKNQAARSNLRDRLNQEHIQVQSESQLAPILYLEVTVDQIRTLNKWKEVTGIFLRETEKTYDLADSMAISNVDDVINTLGWDGTGVSVCVWEDGPDNLTNLIISDHYTLPWPGNSPNSLHSRLVTGIIRNNESGAPHGYAPAATIYVANDGAIEALEWCLGFPRQTTVVNQSSHWATEAQNGDLSFEDILKDYLVLQEPYPTIIQAAGNYLPGDSDDIIPPEDEFVNHKGYNSLSVGNHNDTATAIANTSVFRNPNSPNSDRELPELCANGAGVIAVGINSPGRNGTSYSSPAVAGTVALLQEVDSTLTSWPEGSRAILLAGATLNVSGDTWQQDNSDSVDAQDGSGALDAEESVQITTNPQETNNSASMRGWNRGMLDDSTFDSNDQTTFSYHIQVPMTGGTHVKVALAWDSEITMSGPDPVSSELAMDLDLHIYHGSNLIAASSSWDNSYEIAEFEGEAGETYTVKVRRYSGEGESTWYGLAWTVR